MSHSGFSLLEVILALAILAMAMPIIGQLAQFGLTSARQAEDMTQAAIVCESVMAEIVCGARPLDSVLAAEYEGSGIEDVYDAEGNPMFLYSIISSTADQPSMLQVTVIVERPGGSAPVRCELDRLMIDPAYAASVADAAAAMEATE